MSQITNVPMFARWRRAALSLLCVFVMLAIFPHTAFAHPMGNFSVNRYSRLDVGTEAVQLLYIVDMAEIPTHAERTAMDINRDDVISPEEEQGYLEAVAATLPAQLLLTLNGAPTAWTPGARHLRFAPGQADLPTLRMEFAFSAALPPTGDAQELQYTDQSYADRLGWQEVIVAPGAEVELLASDVPQDDLSNALHEYPVDLLQSPPAVHSAHLRWQLASGLSSQNTQQTTTGEKRGQTTTSLGGDRFAELVSIELGPWAILVALLAAFGWGAAHALSPGHGKTIVAAYLVGARGTFAHALFLGATTTITHTLGVFVLGLATLAASQYILPERIYPWLSTLSGLLVIAIGLSIGWNRLRALVRGEPLDHHHDHAHPGHTHHEHDHSHGHSHAGSYYHSHNQSHNHNHDLGHSHAHQHEAHAHSHLPPGADGGAVTWRGLLALGISGGLLPCPSALVVLLGAIALERVAFGLLLILMFSLGLATVLTAFGLLLLRAGKLFERIPESSRYARYLAVASAAFITLVGAGITVRALIEIGILAGFA
ncbi:MAG: sulfite exporter TauE/SafE family protein [Caldilineaceae bacterium]|nr:sulfite exporter TauE/SafE family protein [Caldilineaceae bacterium]